MQVPIENNMDIIMWSALHSASLEGINEVDHASLLCIIDAIEVYETPGLLIEPDNILSHEVYKTSSCTYGSLLAYLILNYVFNGLQHFAGLWCQVGSGTPVFVCVTFQLYWQMTASSEKRLGSPSHIAIWICTSSQSFCLGWNSSCYLICNKVICYYISRADEVKVYQFSDGEIHIRSFNVKSHWKVQEVNSTTE